MTLEELVRVISTSKKRPVLLRRLGPTLWQGLCPFHKEKSPSFNVFVGKNGAARYHCQGCKEGGTGEWWVSQVEGNPAPKETAEERKARLQRKAEEARKAREISDFYDRNPESVVPIWMLKI